MKKILYLPLILFLLAGCKSTGSLNDSIGDDSYLSGTTEIVSELVSDTHLDNNDSITSTEDENTSQPSGEIIDGSINLNKLRTTAHEYSPNVNAQGVYTSDLFVEFDAKLLTLLDFITTQSGYTSRYKALVANDTGYIFISMNFDAYNELSKYADLQQVYSFRGYLGLYNDEAEIVMDTLGRATYHKGKDFVLPYNDFSVQKQLINNVYHDIKSSHFNSKGILFMSAPITISLKYIAKIEHTIALFTDGFNVIQVHGHDKVNNGLTINSVYELTALRGLYNFKPQLKYIKHEQSTISIMFNEEKITQMTSTNLYNHKYDLNKVNDSGNFTYAALLINVYSFKGYANYYIKDNAYNIVFEDSPKDGYVTQNLAYNSKAMFVNNENCLKMFKERDFDNCPFWSSAVDEKTNKTEVEFYFIPYLWNTLGYWQVHILTDLDI